MSRIDKGYVSNVTVIDSQYWLTLAFELSSSHLKRAKRTRTLAGFAGLLGESVRRLRASDTSALRGACAGMLGERGLGLVVHFPLGYVAKINSPYLF